MPKTPDTNGGNPFAHLDFSPKTDDEKFALLNQCRQIILSAFPQGDLATMIIRRAEGMRNSHKGDGELKGTVLEAKEDLLMALAVTNAWKHPRDPNTPIWLWRLKKKWGVETKTYLRLDLQPVMQTVIDEIAPGFLAQPEEKTSE